MMISTKKKLILIACGLLGCFCFGGGDWLMMYGNPAFLGNISWLTEGVAEIPQWRYTLAMLLAFPGIILYGAALFLVEDFIIEDKHKKIYHYLNVFGLTPWLALHLFYLMILSLFSWMCQNAYEMEAQVVCEALFSNMSFVVPISEGLMLPVFMYWFYLQITGKTVYPRWMAFTNVLFIFGVLKLITLIMPEGAFRLGFINGLMSESMAIWFLIMVLPKEL